MKKFCLTAAALATLSAAAPAFAADLAPAYKAPVVAPVPYFTWTGFYVGGHVGFGWAAISNTELPPGSPAFPVGTPFTRHNISGVLGGVQGGFNWQTIYNLVIGVEGEFSWADISGSVSTPSIALPAFVASSSAKLEDIALVTGRLGYAANNWLLYVKGGGAWGHGTSSGIVAVNGALFETTSSTADRTGWVVGAGVEWAFAPNWTAKLEYDHIDFGSKTITSTGSAGTFSFLSSSERVEVVKAGFNYLFTWGGGPVVAKY